MLADMAFSRSSLKESWEHIQRRVDDQIASQAIERFAENSDERLTELEAQLHAGSYEPLPLGKIRIPKKSGGERSLLVPCVRDRIVERSVLSAVLPFVDRHLGPSSFAFRPGIGVVDAVQAVATLRDEGMNWVLRADIDNCFDSIPRRTAVRALLAMLPDDSLNGLIGQLTERLAYGPRGLFEVPGIPQGTALSPLLANIALRTLDDAVSDRGMSIVRYADDFVVVGRSREVVWEAARVATEALDSMGMALGSDKTEFMTFDEGFCFLGEDFGPRYPPVTDQLRLDEPTRKILYAGRQGSRIFTKSGRIVVQSKDNTELLSVPKNLVSRIVCFGAVGIAAGTRSWTLESGVDVVFLSRRGSLLGQQLAADSTTRLKRLRAQLEFLGDETRSLALAREIADTKIGHQVTLLQRFATDRHTEVVQNATRKMREMRAMLRGAAEVSELMGLEGAAAAAYFPALGQLLPAELVFTSRSRRPPMDVANSALGYGYALLLSECVSALVAAGLDPAIGVLHSSSGRRPGLALDMMEEWRPLIVDQVVLRAARRRSLGPEHGVALAGESGVHLSKAGKSVLVDAYERRMLQNTSGALPGFSGTLRRHLYRQATRLMRSMVDPDHQWTGTSWR